MFAWVRRIHLDHPVMPNQLTECGELTVWIQCHSLRSAKLATSRYVAKLSLHIVPTLIHAARQVGVVHDVRGR